MLFKSRKIFCMATCTFIAAAYFACFYFDLEPVIFWLRKKYVKYENKVRKFLNTRVQVWNRKGSDRQEVSRCHTRGESQESIARRQPSTQARGSTLALKSRVHVTRSPKSVAPQKELMSSEHFKRNEIENFIFIPECRSVHLHFE